MVSQDTLQAVLPFLLVPALIHLLPLPLLAQDLPGQPRAKDRWEVEKARYRAEMLKRVNLTLEEWQEAWDEDEPVALAGAYAEDGYLLLTDEEVQGREDIEVFFANALPKIGPITFSLTDFDVGGSVAMVMGTYYYSVEDTRSSGSRVSGRCIAVFVESRGDWKIRSHLFKPLSSGP
jgi:ketosteroid isomerase-like protein